MTKNSTYPVEMVADHQLLSSVISNDETLQVLLQTTQQVKTLTHAMLLAQPKRGKT